MTSGQVECNPQALRLLERLRRGPIDPMQAWSELGIYRLAARVFELRGAGVPVITYRRSVHNRWGESASIAIYSLWGESQWRPTWEND